MPYNVVAFSTQRWGGVTRKTNISDQGLCFQSTITNLTTRCHKHMSLFCLACTSCLHLLPPATLEAGSSALKYVQLPLDLILNSMRKGVVQEGGQ